MKKRSLDKKESDQLDRHLARMSDDYKKKLRKDQERLKDRKRFEKANGIK